MGEANGNSEYTNIIQNISERQDIGNLKEKFPKLFSRQRKIKGYKIKCEYKKEAIITQQKGRRISLQLQEAVEAEIDKLLKEGHIRRVEKISDEVFHTTSSGDGQKGQNRQNRIRCQIPDKCHPERKVPNAKLGQFDGTSSLNNKRRKRRGSTVHVTRYAICICTN